MPFPLLNLYFHKREGSPKCYERIDDVEVELRHERVKVFTYTVVEKDMNEIKPSVEYLDVVYKGMERHFCKAL